MMNPIKLTTLFQTINLSLSAPDLSTSMLQHSKTYIFLVPQETKPCHECITGCIIAQCISTTMAVVIPSSSTTHQDPDSEKASTVIIIDIKINLCCSPEHLLTPIGIPHLFISLSHRQLGISLLWMLKSVVFTMG